jgi:hypothetical protein
VLRLTQPRLIGQALILSFGCRRTGVVGFSVKEMGDCRDVSAFFNLFRDFVLTEGKGIAYDALARNVNFGFASVSANGVSKSHFL